MQQPTRTILASLLVLSFSQNALAVEKNTKENITFFSAMKAKSPTDVLRQNAEEYGLPSNLNNLVLTKVQDSILGKHYYYQQMLRGLPVDRAEIIVSIGKNGELLKIFNETKHISEAMEANAINQLFVQQKISADDALNKAWGNMKVQHPLVAFPSNQMVWVPTKNGVQLAHKVNIAAQMPTGGFTQ